MCCFSIFADMALRDRSNWGHSCISDTGCTDGKRTIQKLARIARIRVMINRSKLVSNLQLTITGNAACKSFSCAEKVNWIDWIEVYQGLSLSKDKPPVGRYNIARLISRQDPLQFCSLRGKFESQLEGLGMKYLQNHCEIKYYVRTNLRSVLFRKERRVTDD